ncbi:MAG: alanine dehydrogenase, partial [Gammaproteobacteria bacterium]|nr:alanine dehydrogenase [Gammaproteobacteria bacterium]
MKIGIPREIQASERRVACTPDETRKLIKLGHEVLVETNAGQAAGFSDNEYA